MQEFRKFLREDDGYRARIAGVNGNREATRVAIVTIDVALRFPDAVGVPGWMIGEPNKKDFGPEIPIERVLRFYDSEIVARGDDAPVEDHEVFFSGSKNDSLLTSGESATQQNYAGDRR